MFINGAKAMLPIIAGVAPFGLVMGTLASNYGISLLQTMSMNFIVFAGAAQLTALDLMNQGAPSIIIILTGIIINLRFLLYSASMSLVFKGSNFITKLAGCYTLTDQTYSVLAANKSKLNSNAQKISFYFGAAFIMVLSWQMSVLLGFLFGNFAPNSISLDYAVPLSFIALVMPTIKNKTFIYVALSSAILSTLLKPLPLNLGLLLASTMAISLGAYLSRKKRSS